MTPPAVLTVHLLLVWLALEQAAAETYIFWTEPSTKSIRRLDVGSGTVVSVVDCTGSPAAVAVDSAEGKILWVESGVDGIWRADVDGTGVELLVTGAVQVTTLAIDTQNSMLYWSESTGGALFSSASLKRSALDGTGVQVIESWFIGSPQGLVADPQDSRLLWTDSYTEDISFVTFDGSTRGELGLSTSLRTGLALDTTARKLYWANAGTNTIERSNLDGSSLEEVASSSVSDPAGLALARNDGDVYWANSASSDIQRASMDGNGSPVAVVGGASSPSALAAYEFSTTTLSTSTATTTSSTTVTRTTATQTRTTTSRSSSTTTTTETGTTATVTTTSTTSATSATMSTSSTSTSTSSLSSSSSATATVTATGTATATTTATTSVTLPAKMTTTASTNSSNSSNSSAGSAGAAESAETETETETVTATTTTPLGGSSTNNNNTTTTSTASTMSTLSTMSTMSTVSPTTTLSTMSTMSTMSAVSTLSTLSAVSTVSTVSTITATPTPTLTFTTALPVSEDNDTEGDGDAAAGNATAATTTTELRSNATQSTTLPGSTSSASSMSSTAAPGSVGNGTDNSSSNSSSSNASGVTSTTAGLPASTATTTLATQQGNESWDNGSAGTLRTTETTGPPDPGGSFATSSAAPYEEDSNASDGNGSLSSTTSPDPGTDAPNSSNSTANTSSTPLLGLLPCQSRSRGLGLPRWLRGSLVFLAEGLAAAGVGFSVHMALAAMFCVREEDIIIESVAGPTAGRRLLGAWTVAYRLRLFDRELAEARDLASALADDATPFESVHLPWLQATLPADVRAALLPSYHITSFSGLSAVEQTTTTAQLGPVGPLLSSDRATPASIGLAVGTPFGLGLLAMVLVSLRRSRGKAAKTVVVADPTGTPAAVDRLPSSRSVTGLGVEALGAWGPQDSAALPDAPDRVRARARVSRTLRVVDVADELLFGPTAPDAAPRGGSTAAGLLELDERLRRQLKRGLGMSTEVQMEDLDSDVPSVEASRSSRMSEATSLSTNRSMNKISREFRDKDARAQQPGVLLLEDVEDLDFG